MIVRLLVCLGIGFALAGCAAAPIVVPTLLDAVLGGIGIYQRQQDRIVQQHQTEQIRALAEEVRKLREVVGFQD